MSRSNPEVILENPATRFFSWKGDTGTLVWYDREKKENVPVKFPFKFMVLEQVAQVAGGIKRYGDFISYFSNAVKMRDIKSAWLTVKSKVNGQIQVEGEGVWGHIKATVPGSKFMTGLYIAFQNDEKQLEIGYLKLKGAANSAWIDFNNQINRKNIFEGAYGIKSRSEEKQNGNTTYYEPVFTWSEKVTDETEAQATELDRILQTTYLVPYFAQQGEKAMAAAAGVTEDYTEGYTGPDISLEPPDDAGSDPEDLDDDSNIPF